MNACRTCLGVLCSGEVALLCSAAGDLQKALPDGIFL